MSSDDVGKNGRIADRSQVRKILDSIMRPKNFLKDVLVLFAGAGTAQVITVLAAPLLSRLYSPAEFAGLALLTAVLGITSRVSSLKYETAIATGRGRSEMGALAAIATWILLAFTAAAVIIPILSFSMLQDRLGLASAIAFCVCLPIVVFADGMIQILVTWAVRWREFETVSANQVVRNAVSVFVQGAGGIAGIGGFGLMIGQAVGACVALTVLGLRRTIRELLNFSRRSSSRRLHAAARRFRDFPVYQMPKAILNSLGRYLPTILIPIYFSAAATGLFFLALRLTALPTQLIAQSIGRVLLQRFAVLFNEERRSLLPLMLRSTMGFIVIGAPIIVLMMLFGREIFGVFLGKEWAEAGDFAAWTVLWSVGTMCSVPAQRALLILRKNNVLLAIESLWVLPRLLPFPYFAATGEVHMAVALSCSAALMNNITMIGAGLFMCARDQNHLRTMAQ